MKTSHAHFAGSITETYHRHLGPLLFEPYAEDLTRRLDLGTNQAPRVLELGDRPLRVPMQAHVVTAERA